MPQKNSTKKWGLLLVLLIWVTWNKRNFVSLFTAGALIHNSGEEVFVPLNTEINAPEPEFLLLPDGVMLEKENEYLEKEFKNLYNDNELKAEGI